MPDINVAFDVGEIQRLINDVMKATQPSEVQQLAAGLAGTKGPLSQFVGQREQQLQFLSANNQTAAAQAGMRVQRALTQITGAFPKPPPPPPEPRNFVQSLQQANVVL